jgi:hypothetical protein
MGAAKSESPIRTLFINIAMKLHDILNETPLPPDWDKESFSSDKSFASRVRYAQERAKKIGTGSSRIAFEIEYEGRPTILKVAKNKKGIAQNEYESQMFGDYYLTGMQMTIPMIDHDEENDPPIWIHTEKAEKMKPNQFKQFFGGLDPYEVIKAVDYLTGKVQTRNISPERVEQYNELFEENEYINNLVDIIGNYDLPAGDFTRLANWGVYKNSPVIIDIGGSSEVMKLHYS